MKIVIDAGHGGKDSGALGHNIQEKDVVLNIAHHLGIMLKKRGINVLMTRRSDVYLSLGERCRIANEVEADLFVSVHSNSYNKYATGIETYCFDKSTTAGDIANHVQDSMMKMFPDHLDRGVKEAAFYVLKNTDMPAILVECEFIDSMSEFLSKDGTQHKFAMAIADGIAAKYGMNHVEDDANNKEDVVEEKESILDKILKLLTKLFK